jgi:hypothetical protein
MIRNGAGESAADNATNKRAAGGPAGAGRVKMKQRTQITDGAADYDVVVTEQQST